MTKKILTLAAVSVMFLSQNASAMEAGSFFLKAGAGYSMGDTNFKSSGNVSDATVTTATPTSLVSSNKIKNLKGANAEIGFGYIINESAWTDLTVSYEKDTKKKIDDTKVNSFFTKIESKNIKAMLNAYYGLNVGTLVTPYVTVGIGGGVNKTSLTLASGTTFPMLNDGISGVTGPLKDNSVTPAVALASSLKSKNAFGVAYQGGFGVAFNISNNFGFDIGYRIGNNPEAKFFKGKNGLKIADSSGTPLTGIMNLKTTTPIKHTVLAGIKVAF